MAAVYKTVAFEPGEFEARFPRAARRKDLSESDRVRLALGLEPRKKSAGAPHGNKNAVGNAGRWASCPKCGTSASGSPLLHSKTAEEMRLWPDRELIARQFVCTGCGNVFIERRDLMTGELYSNETEE